MITVEWESIERRMRGLNVAIPLIASRHEVVFSAHKMGESSDRRKPLGYFGCRDSLGAVMSPHIRTWHAAS